MGRRCPEYRSLVQPVGLGRWLVGPLPRRARPGVLDAACLAFHCMGARLQGRAPKWFLVALNLMCGCGLASLFSLSSPSCVASLLFLCCPLLVLPSSSLSLPPSVSLVASLPSPLSPLLPRLRGSSGELFKTALWVMIVPWGKNENLSKGTLGRILWEWHLEVLLKRYLLSQSQYFVYIS